MPTAIAAQNMFGSTGLVTLYTCPLNNTLATIVNIKFNETNNSAYTLAFFIKRKNISFQRALYSLVLDAGDFINDDTTYYLAPGDSLQAQSDSPNAVYIINGKVE